MQDINVNLERIKRKTVFDEIVRVIFLIISVLCASVILMIVGFILFKGISPFCSVYQINGNDYRVSFGNFITGMVWSSPTTYGVLFIILNTIYVVFLSTLIAVPISVLTALFIVRIAPKYLSKTISFLVELLASIPSVIFGLFGMGVVTGWVKNFALFWSAVCSFFTGQDIFIQTAGGLSTMSTVIVLVMMIIPTITMLSVTSIKAVNKNLIQGSLALGASMTQTNFKVVLSTAKSGIFSGIILGVGRALGEATAISMVCGNSGEGFTLDLFQTTRTLTSTMLQGIAEATGLNYDIRFSVGVVLIIIIIVTNYLLTLLKRKIGKMS